MDRLTGSVILVTGASSGIGYDIAKTLAGFDCTVYGGARRVPAGEKFRGVFLDVTSEESVSQCVGQILRECGKIDILIHCAGNGIAGAMEDCTGSDALAQLDVNTVGALRVARAVLPQMRSRGSGVILNIGSIGGIFALPFQGLYSMSKAALRKMTDCLRLELAPYGVQACTIEPGDLKTGFTAARRYTAATAGSDYEPACRRAVAQMAHDEENGADPACVTKLVLRLLRRKKLPAAKAVGGVYCLFPILDRLLPTAAVEFILKKMYHVEVKK